MHAPVRQSLISLIQYKIESSLSVTKPVMLSLGLGLKTEFFGLDLGLETCGLGLGLVSFGLGLGLKLCGLVNNVARPADS